MQLFALQHVPFEGLGSIQNWADRRKIDTRLIRVFKNDPLPSPSEVRHAIILGGPMGVHDHHRFAWLQEEKRFIRDLIGAGSSMLGICLGAQLIADCLGAKVYKNRVPEIGWFPIHKSPAVQSDERAAFLPASLDVFHWHGDTFDLPQGAHCLAYSRACRHQGFLLENRIIGLQFHLETTPDSMQALIENCSDELGDGPFVQSAAEMRRVTNRFTPNQQIMEALLQQWIKA